MTISSEDLEKVTIVMNDVFKVFANSCDEKFGVVVEKKYFYEIQISLLTTFLFYGILALYKFFDGKFNMLVCVDQICSTVKAAMLTNSVDKDNSSVN